VVPDAATARLFLEQFVSRRRCPEGVNAKTIDKLFVRFDAAQTDYGYHLVMGGQLGTLKNRLFSAWRRRERPGRDLWYARAGLFGLASLGFKAERRSVPDVMDIKPRCLAFKCSRLSPCGLDWIGWEMAGS
jgi:hypothetical protein